MWHKSIPVQMFLIVVDDNQCQMALEACFDSCKLVFIRIYFPCFVNNDNYETDSHNSWSY